MLTATCLKTGLDSTMTMQVGDRQHSIHLDGQARNPGLPSLRECISRSYGQARWLYELPGMATDPESDKWADGVKTIRIPQHLGIGIGTSRNGSPHCITSIQAGFIHSLLLLLREIVIEYPCLRVYVAQIHVNLTSRFLEFLPESNRRPRD